jgi:hypothetical protein
MVFIFPNSTTKKLFMIYISNIWPKSGTKRLYFLVRREYVASFCSQYFICFFRLMLQVCLSECCLCFTHMFANVLFRCCICFLVVSSVFRCFCKCFRCMFQVFICLQTYVTSVLFEYFKSRLGVTSSFSPSAASSRCLLLATPARHPPPPPSLLDVGDVWDAAGPHVSVRNNAEKILHPDTSRC